MDGRGPWLGLLLAGVGALAWPLARTLPRVGYTTGDRSARRERLRWWGWRGQALPTLLPAVMTPLLLWPLPGDFLPVLLGDYLLLFVMYGLSDGRALAAWRRLRVRLRTDGLFGSFEHPARGNIFCPAVDEATDMFQARGCPGSSAAGD